MKKFIFALITLSVLLFILISCASEGDDEESSAKEITAFGFTAADNSELKEDVVGEIDEPNRTITITLDFFTDLSALVASFNTSGVSASVDDVGQVSGVTANNFSDGATYTVTAQDGSSQDYTITIVKSLINHKAYLKPSNNSEWDQFGYSVAMDGDTLVVGAVGEESTTKEIVYGSDLSTTNDNGRETGAVYIFKRAGEMWIQEAYLKAPNGTSYMPFPYTVGDYFGTNVAISGNTVVVGVPYEDSSTSDIINGADLTATNDNLHNAGSVYVFSRSGSTWSHQAYLKPPNPSQSDSFGSAIAIDGDTIVVGVPGEDSGTNDIIHNSDLSTTNDAAPNTGAACVYTRKGTTWSLQAYLKAPNAGNYDAFGDSVSISGDSIAVGARREQSTTTTIIHGDDFSSTNNSGDRNGAVYLFTRSGSTWSHQAYLKAPNNTNEDYFGSSVALSGDSLAVGAYGESSTTKEIINNRDLSSTNDSGNDNGAVYIFVRHNGIWSFQSYLKAPNTSNDDLFGSSLALSGAKLMVGAFHEDSTTKSVLYGDDLSATNNGQPNCGAVYLFTRIGTTWSHQAYLKAPNRSTDDFFGESITFSGSTIAIGAKYEDGSTSSVIYDDSLWGTNNDGNQNGAVYVFR